MTRTNGGIPWSAPSTLRSGHLPSKTRQRSSRFCNARRHATVWSSSGSWSRGLLQIAATQTAAALAFITEDPRRLALGSFDDEYFDTLTLVKAIVPHLNDAQLVLLEAAILAWRRYASQEEGDAEFRFQMVKGRDNTAYALSLPHSRKTVSPPSLRH